LRAVDGGSMLLSTGADGLARLWEANSGQLRAAFGRHPDDVHDALAAGPDRVWTAGRDGSLREWLRADGAERARRSGREEGELGGWDPRRDLLLLTGPDSAVHARRLDGGDTLLRLPGHPPVTRFAAASPDGRRLATAGIDGLVRLHDARDGSLLAELPCRQDVWHVAFTADGARLAAACGDGVARVWDVATATQQLEIQAHLPGVRCTAFTPDGAVLLTASEHPDDGRLRAWDARDGRPAGDLFEPGHRPIALAVSPDGRWAASGGWDRSIALWDLRSLALARRWEAHDDRVNALAFSADGRRLASGGFDGAVALWEAPGGARLWTSEGREGICVRIGFTADGVRLVSGHDGYGVRTWPVDVEAAARGAVDGLLDAR
jgi:WD40 repeat protein